jgi:hypothetical protein
MLTGRRLSKNSGGEIAPAAIAGLIKGVACSVNAFPPLRNRLVRPGGSDKTLMRLNFSGRTAIG